MEDQIKARIYKGMIQYILGSTSYNLKHIAQLSNSSLENVRSIYCHELLPKKFKSEIQLTKLFQIVLEVNKNQKSRNLLG